MLTEEQYEKLKQLYNDVEESLTLSDYEYILEENDFYIARRTTKEWFLSSSCHNIDAKDGDNNLRFYIDTKTFYCYSHCMQSWNIYSLLSQRWGLIGKPCKKTKVLKYLCDYKKIPFNFNIDIDISKSKMYNWQTSLNKYLKGSTLADLPNYDKSVINNYPKIYHTDWLDFGISESTLDKYNIRYYEYQSQIVIPVYSHNGNLIGIRVRNMNPNNIKYIPLSTLNGTMYNFPSNAIFYGECFNEAEIKRTKVVNIVEAEKSVLKSDTWFDNKSVTLGLLGSALGKQRLDYLISLGVEEVNLMLDSDFEVTLDENGEPIINQKQFELFQDKVYKLYDFMSPYFNKIYIVYNNLGYTDMYKANPFDFDIDRYNKLCKSKELIE